MGHQSRQEIIWIAPKKSHKLLGRFAPLMFMIRVQAFQDSLHEELPHVQTFMNDGPNPLTWDAQLLSHRFSQNPAVFQDELVNLIINLQVVPVLSHPGEGSSQVQKSPRLNWATQFLMVACSPNVSVRMAWISFGNLPCRGGMTCFLLASVTRKDLQFGTWTDPSLYQHYWFHPTTSGSKSG